LAEIHLFRRDFILTASRFIVSRWFTHICRKFIEGEKLFFRRFSIFCHRIKASAGLTRNQARIPIYSEGPATKVP